MNENINLCKLLEGHEGETFYSPAFGNIKLLSVDDDNLNDYPIYCSSDCYFLNNGRYSKYGECMLFPSKDQRDWEKWAEEQKPKGLKTWKELCQEAQVEQIEVTTDVIIDDNDEMIDKSHAVAENIKLAKSALALLKIYQLIEIGYGGNITYEEWEDEEIPKWCIIPSSLSKNSFYCNDLRCYSSKYHIAFHTRKLAEEFMSYPENVQLFKDFHMI